jgi:outer membrane protein OmpA-like peptidoglycan-associated protein
MNLVSNTARAFACAVLVAFGAAGCTTTPERVAEVEEARTAVETLATQPEADAASSQLAEARDALARADAGLENGASLEQVRHDAYLARRHAEVGMQVASEAEALEAIEDAEAERRNVQLQARTAEADAARQLAGRRTEQARQSAREAERSQEVAEAAIEEAQRMAGELRDIKAEQTERGMVLTLSEVLFDTDSDELKQGADLTVDRLAEFLRNNPERKLLIEGHTDSRGAEEYNVDLAQRRANALAEELVQRGIPSDRLRPVGLGEAYPVASNDHPAGMQQNRRVEIVISNRDGSFPESAEERVLAMRP